jgi:hypothetical protein
MAYVALSYVPNREMYEAVAKHLDVAGNRPSGLLAHAAAELPDGRVQLVDVWASSSAVDGFEQDRLVPAFDALGVPPQVREGGRPQIAETFDLLIHGPA